MNKLCKWNHDETFKWIYIYSTDTPPNPHCVKYCNHQGGLDRLQPARVELEALPDPSTRQNAKQSRVFSTLSNVVR